MANPSCCAVRAALSIQERAQQLKEEIDHPITIYKDIHGQVHYINNKDIDNTLHSIVKAVYNISTKEELSRWSTHSILIGADVTIHIAGTNAEAIKLHPRWRSNTFMLYLRDVPVLATKHNQIIYQANADDS